MIPLSLWLLALRKHDVCLLIAIQPKMSLDEKFNTAQNFASQVSTMYTNQQLHAMHSFVVLEVIGERE